MGGRHRDREEAQRTRSLHDHRVAAVERAEALKGRHDASKGAAGRRRLVASDAVRNPQPAGLGVDIGVVRERPVKIRWLFRRPQHPDDTVLTESLVSQDGASIAAATGGMPPDDPVAEG